MEVAIGDELCVGDEVDGSFRSSENEHVADIIIVGGGPAGLTIARECSGRGLRILLIESGGREQSEPADALNAVENIGSLNATEQIEMRRAFHGESTSFWTPEAQGYGVRCRVVGGSTAAWAGKSAPFDELDFAARDWVADSGWPVAASDLAPYLARAVEAMNLGPPVKDAEFWAVKQQTPPAPQFPESGLVDFFWQFAKSRLDPLDVLRFGPDFLSKEWPDVEMMLNSTVTELFCNESRTRIEGVRGTGVDGGVFKATAPVVVLAASSIENARLLLLSGGLGNAHDQVGRYLMDHPSARVGQFPKAAAKEMSGHFGFYGLPHKGQTHMYMRGLALNAEYQREQKLLNGAVYFLENRAKDDPVEAIKRLIKLKSDAPMKDTWSVAKSPGTAITAIGLKALQGDKLPHWAKSAVVNSVLRLRPNLAAREFQSRGVQHKLDGLWMDAISEQAPNRESRITLSDKLDRYGNFIPRVDWKLQLADSENLLRLAQITDRALAEEGLPRPELVDWVRNEEPEKAVIIDMAHSIGTTRMSSDPRGGVVNENCEVHGVKGLFVGGASVFPTSGHANPTLMIVTFATRLADHILEGAVTEGSVSLSS